MPRKKSNSPSSNHTKSPSRHSSQAVGAKNQHDSQISSQQATQCTTVSTSQSSVNSLDMKTVSIKAKADMPADDPDLKRFKPRRAFSIPEWIRLVTALGPKRLAREYIKIRYDCDKYIQTVSSVAYAQNRDKNRYEDIPVHDKTRVRLRDRPCDYIHASYVVNDTGRKYIITQGPLDNTIEDFWYMVWQENVQIIVMLCKPVEDDAEKCYQYWKNEIGGKLRIGNFCIETERKVQKTHFLETKIRIVNVRASASRVLIHMGFCDWPDRGEPNSEQTLCKVVDQIISRSTKQDKVKSVNRNPILFHCSAGIGRSGTLVSICLCIDFFNSHHRNKLPDILELVHHKNK